MTTKNFLILAFIVLITLPLIWVILKASGVPTPSTDGFWRDYLPWAIAFLILIGSSVLINKLKKK
jgi:phosphatidylglycerophosphate synthase